MRGENMAIVWSYKMFKADAEKVYMDIENIEEKTPQNLVDYAEEHPDSELHKCFTWDDSKAANSWRKYEARQVMRCLVYKDESDEEESVQIRVLQNVRQEYKPVRQIVMDNDEYKALIKRAKAELASFRERYKGITELETVLEAIDGII